MAFNSNDLYTLSGGVEIFNYWNPFVTKHDTSSFYNWEQDNLPLYDLEERTYYLWEKFGYPLSAVPSMALLVSSTIPTDSTASANVFTSVSAAIESLPEIIRMPTLIEVALSGDLGTIELNNIKCEEDGVLEIINRGFAPLAEWAEISGTGAMGGKASIYSNAGADAHDYTPNVFSALGPIQYYTDSSALAFSANTADLFPAATKNGFFRSLSFATAQCSATATSPSKPGYAWAGVGNDEVLLAADGNTLSMWPLARTSFTGNKVTDSTIDTLDVSTYSPIDGEYLIRSQPQDAQQILNGTLTANRVSHIKIENSDGPIYVRGFIVDGYDDVAGAYSTEVGIGVYNCNNVSLEDCGATRCTYAGYEINNSKVKLRRRNLAIRNYDTASRSSVSYKSYGFKISNSEVEYKTDSSYSVGTAACLGSFFQTYGMHLSNSKLFGGDLGPGLADSDVVQKTTMRQVTPLEVGYNKFGVYADSSEYDIKGLSDIYNNEINIKANGSVLRTGRFMVEFASREGIDLDNSKFILNTDFEKKIRSYSDTIYTTPAVTEIPFSRLGMFTKNRRHILLDNGSYYGPDYPTELSSYKENQGALADAYSMIEYNFAFGIDDKSTSSQLPSISINNSRAVMPATTLRTVNTNGDASFVKGLGIQATNGGVCKLIGYGDENGGNSMGRTYIIGGTSFQGQQKSSAIAAVNNSTVYITGPTGIAQYGIGILSDNNSVIKASPVLSEDDNSYDGSGWGRMQNAVGTCLDIHATRACAVASNNSQLRFEDLGYFPNFWPTAQVANADYAPLGLANSDNIVSSLCQAGALQFFPNPVDGNMAITTLGSTNFNSLYTPTANPAAFDYDTSLSCNRVLYNASYGGANTASQYRAQATRGGVCVVATGDSEVFVRNVHFPTGQYNTDGDFFDPSASIGGCNDLQIWNIQDTSRLNASYATVSGAYPSLRGYTGPRSFYSSGVLDIGEDSSAVSYAGFSGTPDTASLSVLDHYGSGVSVSAGIIRGGVMPTIQTSRTGDVNTYGPDSYENRGPYRLFFPVNPEAKILSYIGASSNDTRPYQHLAQGYALSGAVSATPSLSATYPNILNPINQYTGDVLGGAYASGHYFPDTITIELSASVDFSGTGYTTNNPMLPNNSNANVLLDESFSNTFSNAKHCNTNYSGRKRLVSIYKASTAEGGECFPGDEEDRGQGFTSTNIFDVERDM
tara:strand:- start:2886 stop:6494 length:3609 start_codon:yes stop_codon:yes gene_type:complete